MAKKTKTGINPWTLKKYEIKDKNLHPNVTDCPDCKDEKGAWEHVKSGSKFWTSDAKKLSDERLAICKECEHSRDMFARGWINYCNKCGCMLKIKTRIKSNQCPIGKW